MTDIAAKPKPKLTRKPRSDPAAQYAKFLEAAKEAGADGDEAAADALTGRMAKASPDKDRRRIETSLASKRN